MLVAACGIALAQVPADTGEPKPAPVAKADQPATAPATATGESPATAKGEQSNPAPAAAQGEPPGKSPAAAKKTATPGTTAAPADAGDGSEDESAPKTPADKPATSKGSVQHFEPTEKVRPDFDVAFPVDI
jgi:hypothetical protein